VRVGVHVGHVVSGIVGRRQFLYDIWGDTVNTAQRVELHGVPGRVCLSAAAAAQLPARYKASSIGVVDLKGKGPTELFAVDSRGRAADHPEETLTPSARSGAVVDRDQAHVVAAAAPVPRPADQQRREGLDGDVDHREGALAGGDQGGARELGDGDRPHERRDEQGQRRRDRTAAHHAEHEGVLEKTVPSPPRTGARGTPPWSRRPRGGA
jgi:hypothetical protein